ncbi:hypothetical protein J7J64_09970 [Lysobacter sp. ISL-42]|nr:MULTISPECIES: hypothetical protein [unclassified Lysobacter]MBT2746738.1 hypothetical protein [Lysobacter sp. ISL-42]MBT2751787.1 hypothetical protein [Lysobacter sp. ISL-50]MBT2778139.1 hypothetical protein [Lysobacter sp. ISL-54]MBT2781780.1 hypothetical protein [Lysobacter sp. ISL-52]
MSRPPLPAFTLESATQKVRRRTRLELARSCARCADDLAIGEDERRFHWPQGRRPDEHPSLSTLGL